MGLTDVVDSLEHVEQLLDDSATGPIQDPLSWQRRGDDADIQLGKACAMLGTCANGGAVSRHWAEHHERSDP